MIQPEVLNYSKGEADFKAQAAKHEYVSNFNT